MNYLNTLARDEVNFVEEPSPEQESSSGPDTETLQKKSGTGNLPELPPDVVEKLVQGAGLDVLGQATQTAEEASTKHKSFLYVEDDPFSQEVMRRIFKRIVNYDDLTIFADSENFLKRVKALQHIPDVIFLDVQIEPYDGPTMLKMLRADNLFDQTRIVALTASVMAPEVEALRAAGFDGLIAKPIIKKVFPSLLEQILNGQEIWFVS